jgi:hypothetical protein
MHTTLILHPCHQFTATLDDYMRELYKAADYPPQPEPEWIKIQRCVFSGSADADKELEKMIQVRTEAVVRMPIIRKAIATDKYVFGGASYLGKEVEIKAQETVVLNLVSSSKNGNRVHSSLFPLWSLPTLESGRSNFFFSPSKRLLPQQRSRPTRPKSSFSTLSLALQTSMVSFRQDASPLSH